MENLLFILIAMALVLVNGFFVASEFAMVKLRSTRVDELRKLHGWRGGILAKVHGRLDAYLSACQLGITLASLGLGWIGEPAFARLLEAPAAWLGWPQDSEQVHGVAFVFAFTVTSFLHIVIGELAPKSMAIRQPEVVSLWTAGPLWAFYWGMYPFIWVLNASANGVLRVFGLGKAEGHNHETPYTREELRSILHLSRPAAESDDHRIASVVRHALELPDLEASDLMRTPREMVAIKDGAGYEDVHKLMRQFRYSRYPVVDRDGIVLGILHLKDIVQEEPGDDYAARLSKWMHPPIRISERHSVADLLRQFQQGVSHFALTLDREGMVSGFLTLEDVLEAVFGEITDEHEPHRQQIRRDPHWEADGTLVARGNTALFRIERELGRMITGSGEIGTLSGLLMQVLDRVPTTGDVVTHDGLRLEVLNASGPRALGVRIGSANPEAPLRNPNLPAPASETLRS